jgi:hypothetical protein
VDRSAAQVSPVIVSKIFSDGLNLVSHIVLSCLIRKMLRSRAQRGMQFEMYLMAAQGLIGAERGALITSHLSPKARQNDVEECIADQIDDNLPCAGIRVFDGTRNIGDGGNLLGFRIG